MKKLLYIFAAMAALSTVSCVKENFNEGQEGTTTFYGKAVDVKTQVVDGHTVWSANDNIKVFYNNTNVVAELKTGENTSSATFEAAVGTATDYYAVYPASETASMTDGTMTVTIPATQNGLFGAGHVAVAKAADKTFTFTNVNAFLKMTLTSAQYTRIVVESVAGGALAGDLSITFAGGVPAVAATYANTSSSVEVTSETPFAAGDLYISVLPGVTHTKGLLVTCYNGEQLKGTYYVDKSVATEASVTLTFDVFEPNGNYYVTAEGSGNQNGLSLTNAMSVAKAVELIRKSATDQAALKAIDGAVFNFAAGEYVLADEALALSYAAAEPVKLTFKGEEGTIFSGNETHSIMTISGADVTFEGITVTKSVATETLTGAIKCSGANTSLTMNDCIVSNNTVEEGEEIFCSCFMLTDGASLAARNCVFTENSAHTAPVICSDGAKINMTKCRFEGNWSAGKVGVMLLKGQQESDFIECDFIKNHAWDCGQIQHVNGNTDFVNCNFIENETSLEKFGGVFQLSSDGSGKLTISGGEISSNKSGCGGAVNQESNSAQLEMSGVTIKGNFAELSSGAIRIAGKATINSSILSKNTSSSTDKTRGQCITIVEGGELMLYGCVIEGHSTTTSSSGVAVNAGAKLIMGADSQSNRCLVRNNTAGWGGAIRIQGNAEISDSDFCENYAKGGGAILGSDNATVTLDNCLFEGNYVTSNFGGAVRFESRNELTVKNTIFEGNKNNYKDNSCKGGAISVDNGTLIVDQCRFEGNTCPNSSGAAIATNEGAAGIKVTNTDFVENIVSTNSGAVWLENHSGCEFVNCKFVGNQAGNNGGAAIRLDSAEGTFTFDRCHFEDNVAKRGAAIYVYSWLSSVYLNSCTFTGNSITGEYGTTIWLCECGEFGMNNCTIADDTYTTGGTGAAACWIDVNFCTNNTGGICLTNNTLIGSPRTKDGITTGGGLVRLDVVDAGSDLSESDDYHFINNIIVTEDPSSNKSFIDFGNSYSREGRLYYTKHSGYSGIRGTFTSEESPASDGFSMASFDDLKWNENGCYWSWNGTMSSGNNTAKITKDRFVADLTDAMPGFKTWLDMVNALDKDQLGNSRGNGEWWPGSYQKN